MNYKAILTHIVLLLVCANATVGQSRTESFSFTKLKGKTITVALNYADTIFVYGTNDKTIRMESSVSINENTKNEAWELKIIESSDFIDLESKMNDSIFENEKILGATIVRGHYVKTNIIHKLYVPTNQKVELKTLSGNYIVSNILGPIEINSLSGFIDFSWNSKKPASFKVHSLTGEIYTDLDLNFETKRKHDYSPVGEKMATDYLGGGNEIKLKTLSNHIFIRKSEK